MQITIPYVPLPQAKEFHASPARAKLAVGGKGSGKTLSMLMDALMLSFEYPGNVGLLGRETFGEVQEVLIDPLVAIVPAELVSEYPTAQKKKITFTNGSVIYFRSLDEHRKFKGLNLGFFGIDELDAVTEEDWLQLVGQLRLPGVHRVAMGATNPTTIDHWIYDRFVRQMLPDYEYYRFRTQDNPHNPPDFYEHLAATMPESWVKRYLEGEWGSIILGERVYPEFSEKLHVYNRLQYNPQLPVVRVWDFGNNAATTFFQMRDTYGADFLGEVFRKRLTSKSFAQVVARYSSIRFPGATFEDYGDIAGTHTQETSGMSPIDVVNKELGIHIGYEKIPLKDSLEFVRTKLSQIIAGITALRFSPEMRLSIEGMNGGYVWKKNRDGTLQKGVPATDETFEHIMDTVRYGIWTKFAYNRPARKKVALPPTWDYWN